jgi:uncharacterized membrane protein
MKISFKTEAVSMIKVVLGWVLGWYFYRHFPERVITHWNFKGVADGYSGRAFGSFFVPALLTFMYGLLVVLPHLDPKKANYQQFAGVYNWFKNIIIFFLLTIFFITGLVNLGQNIPINLIVPGLVGIMFIVMGSLMGKIKQNWFMGFRFPWTLSSEDVWNKTQRFGGWAMIFCGGLILISPIFPIEVGLSLFFTGILFMIFGTMTYSYLAFRKEQKNNKTVN